ncbi:hypothetical protein HK097_008905 [Rhizophlyctis rosea]|uniref:UspA domain-containing protein n=1 Tax=Rhizophlyctis rosea TaxID=64517 RepID=A0AAD5X4Z6_9FUNG|nr:hypothetical protein HK097_008905 [Rhizophlyctis rosea]
MADHRTVLVGVETVTKTGIQASPVLRWALRNFVKKGDNLVMLHASKLVGGAGQDSAGYTNVASPEALKDMEQTVEALLREMVRSHNLEAVTVKATIVKADPRDTIAKTAEQLGAVAVIVGRREVGAMKRVLLGSVSDYLAKECNSTVIIVKAD